MTWPRAAYLTGQLPRTRDVAYYVWSLQWVAHQVVHLGNPWFTTHMAAPAGIQLGFSTSMPLAGLILTPVTLAFGPSAAFTLLCIVTPGLACYLMFRAARLWLGGPGAVAAGALFGLSSMLDWQVWYHLNLALGTLFLPLTLEAAVRLRRRPSRRQAVLLGLVLGAAVLTNQESAVLAAGLAAVILLSGVIRPGPAAGPAAPPPAPETTQTAATAPPVPGRAPAQDRPAQNRTAGPDEPAQNRTPGPDQPAQNGTPAPVRARIMAVALAALVTFVVASPQLIAMAQQALAGGAGIRPDLLVRTYRLYGAGLPTLFAPSPRLDYFGLPGLAAGYTYDQPAESVATFGALVTLLALAGLAVGWRRRPVRLLALLWACCAVLALGPTLILGTTPYTPLAENWHGTRLSLLMPYTWLVHLPGLSGLREADRFALLGLVGAAVLAGAAVDWLAARARPLVVVLAALAVFEAGWSGSAHVGTMPTTRPALDRAIAADHSGSIVVDVPYGLRGGIPLFGSKLIAPELLLATSDGHPRALSYTAWVPEPTVRAIQRHPFYVGLVAAQKGRPSSRAQLALARADARQMGVGWALVWRHRPTAVRYLTAVGFRFDYRADGVSVYRPPW